MPQIVKRPAPNGRIPSSTPRRMTWDCEGGCGRRVRAHNAKAADYPGTVRNHGGGKCSACRNEEMGRPIPRRVKPTPPPPRVAVTGKPSQCMTREEAREAVQFARSLLFPVSDAEFSQARRFTNA